MILLGLDHILGLIEGKVHSGKTVFNASGAIFFPVSKQHSDMKAEGISYEDNYKGNALAAMLAPGKIEIRFHKAFSDERVAAVVRELFSMPELAGMRGWVVTYQGRVLECSGAAS
jgi:hypothetical protein